MKRFAIILCLILFTIGIATVYVLCNKRDSAQKPETESSEQLQFDTEEAEPEEKEPVSVLEKVIESVAVIPQKVKEHVAASLVDTLVNKALQTEKIDGAAVFHPKFQSIPVTAGNIVTNGNVISFDFDINTDHYGKIRGSVKMDGNTVQWSGRFGFVANVCANARPGKDGDEALENVLGSINDMFKYIPRQITSVPDDTPVQCAIYIDNNGKTSFFKSDSMTTIDRMQEKLLDMNVRYAVFIVGHMAYDYSIGLDGISAKLQTYPSDKMPDGYSEMIW